MDLGESPIDRDELAVRASCHVAEGQRTGKHVRYRLELEAQNAGKSAFIGFDDGAGVVGDEAAQHGVGVLDIAKVTSTVQRVQAWVDLLDAVEAPDATKGAAALGRLWRPRISRD